jgi:hypothetical protein
MESLKVVEGVSFGAPFYFKSRIFQQKKATMKNLLSITFVRASD